MELTFKQEMAQNLIIKRYKDREKYTVVGGFAGSGKSTIIKFVIYALAQDGLDPEKDVAYVTPTGKAAQVLERKGLKNVSTLHKLLYKSRMLPDGKFVNMPVDKGEIPYKVVVVDEVSMVPLSLIELLFSHDLYVICLGDPFQIPPINKNEDNHLLDNPHIFLDEIHRQALDSEIIRISMNIREGKNLENFNGNDVKIFSKNELNTGMLLWSDINICATNNMRNNLNNQIRELKGMRGDLPREGTKVICCNNYWDIIDTNGGALVNGTIGYLHNIAEVTNRIPQKIFVPKGSARTIPVLHCNLTTDIDTEIKHIDIDRKRIIKGESTLTPQLNYILGKRDKSLIPLEFEYGYCITGHRSQGSQWSKVLVIEEDFPFSRHEHARWLYTTATRSEDKLVIIRKE